MLSDSVPWDVQHFFKNKKAETILEFCIHKYLRPVMHIYCNIPYSTINKRTPNLTELRYSILNKFVDLDYSREKYSKYHYLQKRLKPAGICASVTSTPRRQMTGEVAPQDAQSPGPLPYYLHPLLVYQWKVSQRRRQDCSGHYLRVLPSWADHPGKTWGEGAVGRQAWCAGRPGGSSGKE